jgi:hypothetical protein
MLFRGVGSGNTSRDVGCHELEEPGWASVSLALLTTLVVNRFILEVASFAATMVGGWKWRPAAAGLVVFPGGS